jgi:hypothetical protein
VILSADETKIALNIIGYQYPNLENEPWDSDWLIVELNLNLPVGKWTRFEPCLTTFEVAGFIGWLEEVHNKFEVFEKWRSGRIQSQISFTEPNLEFQVHSNHFRFQQDPNVYFRICLGTEFLPPFKDQLKPYLNPEDIDNVYLDFRITSAQILEIIESLRSQLEQFPVRVGLP